MPRETEWFHRLADVPGLDFAGSPGIDRSTLPGHDAEASVSSFRSGGERYRSLEWQTSGGITSASPAHGFAFSAPSDTSPEGWLRHAYQAIELPGTAGDYHFALQSCIEALWKMRHEHPDVTAMVETLCALDVQLIKVHPATIRFKDYHGQTSHFQAVAFQILVKLYEREGNLREALDVARLADKFDQVAVDPTRLEERIDNVRAEDAHK